MKNFGKNLLIKLASEKKADFINFRNLFLQFLLNKGQDGCYFLVDSYFGCTFNSYKKSVLLKRISAFNAYLKRKDNTVHKDLIRSRIDELTKELENVGWDVDIITKVLVERVTAVYDIEFAFSQMEAILIHEINSDSLTLNLKEFKELNVSIIMPCERHFLFYKKFQLVSKITKNIPAIYSEELKGEAEGWLGLYDNVINEEQFLEDHQKLLALSMERSALRDSKR